MIKLHVLHYALLDDVGFRRGEHGLVLELLLSHADKAMYRAKRAGRNQVALAETTDALRAQGSQAA